MLIVLCTIYVSMGSYIFPCIQKCVEILPDQFKINSSTPASGEQFLPISDLASSLLPHSLRASSEQNLTVTDNWSSFHMAFSWSTSVAYSIYPIILSFFNTVVSPPQFFIGTWGVDSPVQYLSKKSHFWFANTDSSGVVTPIKSKALHSSAQAFVD